MRAGPPLFLDIGQMQQVVVNLVTNAAYAIGDNIGRVDVRLDGIPGDAA